MNIFDKIKDYLLGAYHKLPEKEHDGQEVDPVEVLNCQLDIARKWHGKHEVRDNAELKKFLGFDPAKTPWCAGFVNAVEKQCGRKGTGKLTARSYLKYGHKAGNPKPGDIVVLKRGKLPWQGHVGYFVSKGYEGILVLGGNQSDKVCYKYYPEKALLGYRRP